MVDVMTREQRRRCMAAIKGKNTKPEMLVRKFLFSKGLRYRVNNHKLPGSPDIVFKKYRTVVFIDGCFWHGHEDCKYFHIPKSNTDFWRQKVAANIARDYVNTVDLTLAGWRVVRVWECDVRTKAKREATLEKLYRTIIGEVRAPVLYKSEPGEFSGVAEVAEVAEASPPYGSNSYTPIEAAPKH